MRRIALTVLAVLIVLSAVCPISAQTSSLPSTLVIKQWVGNDTWTWTLTRRGGQPIYDAGALNNQTGARSNHVFELRSFDGRTISFYRQDAGFYNGTVAADGVTVNGKTSFAYGNEGWQMSLGGPMIEMSDPKSAAASPAPAALASRLTIRQWAGSDTWVWTLTRRGSTNIYDAVARHERSGAQSNHVFDLRTFDGKTISFYRNDAGFYKGTVSADGRTVNGTVDFASGGWTMALDGSGPGPVVPPVPPLQGIHYRVENLVFAAPDVYQNPKNLHDFMVDFATCTVQPMIDAAALATLRIKVHVCRAGSRLTFTQTSTQTGSVLDYDWALLNGGKTVAGAWRQGAGFGPSVGGVYP